MKTHLVVVNGIVLASTTFVGAMDFMAPRLSVVPTVVYSATGLVVLLMLAAALAPAAIGRLLGALGLSKHDAETGPVWRRPAWQFSVAILLAVTALGFASVARASEGGIIAGKFPEARRLQESLLALGRDTADISRGVSEANGKLDLLVADARDPQKELTAKGYTYSNGGLATAVARGDAVAAGLFVKSGFKVDGEGPIAALMGGEWHAEIATALPKPMFENPTACPAGLFRWEIKEPTAARIALYKRLCGPSRAIAVIDDEDARDARFAPVGEVAARNREARKFALAELRR
ncbi:MAG: hypothetical protein V4508_08765 [Pseudomonadota bacterium]